MDVNPMTEWRQERPSWCPHTDCLFRRRAMDDMCSDCVCELGRYATALHSDGRESGDR